MEELLQCIQYARELRPNKQPLTLFVTLGGYNIAAQRIPLQEVQRYVDQMVQTLSICEGFAILLE